MPGSHKTNTKQTGYYKVLAMVQDRKFINGMLLVVGAAALATGLFFAYRYYVVYRERSAQKVFSLSVDQFNQIESSSPEIWKDMAVQFEHGYEHNSGSYLAPAMLAREADALVKENKLDEARSVMKRAVESVAASSPVSHLMRTKYALMQLDAANEAERTQGLETLKALADDKENEQRDQALFYLGRYFWVKNDAEQARQTWQTLLADFPAREHYASPWSIAADEFLQQIG